MIFCAMELAVAVAVAQGQAQAGAFTWDSHPEVQGRANAQAALHNGQTFEALRTPPAHCMNCGAPRQRQEAACSYCKT